MGPLPVETQPAVADAPAKPEITYDDFAKLDLRVATVTTAQKIKGSDKLLQLTLQVGGQTRTVVSGIALHYAAEEMVGKQVLLLYNLKPAKLRGVLSEGMLLCAEGPDGTLKLATVEPGVPDGSEVS